LNLYDISILLKEDIVVWEDKFKPEIKQYSFIDKGDLSNTSCLKMDLHTGTHMDLPYHFIEEGKKSDDFDLGYFFMKAIVIECRCTAIERKFLESVEIPENVKAVLFKTNNYLLYRKKKFSKNYTYLDVDGAKFLVEKKIKLVGIDYLSIEKYGENEFPVHKILLGNNILILEGLNLEHVKDGKYDLFAVPLKIANVEALPVRAFLIKREE